MLAMLLNDKSLAANTYTPTTLGIHTGTFLFFKDTGTDMNSYFSHSPNADTEIDMGNYDASLSIINAASSGDHRFTVSDMIGNSFTVTVQTSDLTASGGLFIPAANIGYTGTVRTGTGKTLTAAPTGTADISSAVTFVARANNSGLSKYSQEITLLVNIPAAQAPENYTGTLTFTY